MSRTSVFSLTSILLTTSFLFVLTSAAPIPQSLSATTALLSIRHPVLSISPRYSPLDNFSILPSGRSSRILPRTPLLPTGEPLFTLLPTPPPRNPASIIRKYVDRRGEMRIPRRSFTSTLSTFETTDPTPAPTMSMSRRQSRRDAVVERGAVFSAREAQPSAESYNSAENSPVGPTQLFTGKLWRRGLKREHIA